MNPSNYNSIGLNPHLQLNNAFKNALNVSLINLKKPELRQIGTDLKLPQQVLNLNKTTLIEKIMATIFTSPHFPGLVTKWDLSPYDSFPLLQKILSDALKKVTHVPNASYHTLMGTPLEMYNHTPAIMSQPIFRTTSNFYSDLPQNNPNAPTSLYPTPHFNALQNICLSSSLLCKHGTKGNLLSCIVPDCNRKFHAECLKMPEKEIEKEVKIFECPYCVLEKNDPLSEIKTILLPPFIVNSTEQKQFIIDHYNLKAIMEDASMGIEIKCIKLDYKYINEQTWLDSGELFLNCRKVHEFKPLQINSALKKRKDEKLFVRENLISINTIKFLDFKPSFDQKVNVRYDDTAVYMAGVYLVKRLRSDELIAKIQRTHVKEVESCKTLLYKEFDPHMHDDCKISIDKLSVSLLDILDKQMIKTPAKTVFCSHLQCFSLENFVKVMESTVPRKWRCPICKIKAFDLMIDGYLWSIIKDVKNISASEVIFSRDGTFDIKKTDEEVIGLDNDDDIVKKLENDVKTNEEPTNTIAVKKGDFHKKASNKPEIIILDEDDETTGETIARSEESKSNEAGNNQNLLPAVSPPVFHCEEQDVSKRNLEECNASDHVIEKPTCIPENNEKIVRKSSVERITLVERNASEERNPGKIDTNAEKSPTFERIPPERNNFEGYILEQNNVESSKKPSIVNGSGQEPINLEKNDNNIMEKSVDIMADKNFENQSFNDKESFQIELELNISKEINEKNGDLTHEEKEIIENQKNQEAMEIEIENKPKSNNNLNNIITNLISPKTLQSIEKGVKEIHITTFNAEEQKKCERNSNEITQQIRIYNLEDPTLFMKASEDKENKPVKRKIETLESEFKEKIQCLIQHKTIKKHKSFVEFTNTGTNSTEITDEESQSINLNGNLKSRTFIVKQYKKHFPEVNKETLTKPTMCTTSQLNEMNLLSNATNITNALIKSTASNITPNFNLMGSSYDIASSNIFPLTMFTAGDKALLGNSNNYINFTINPHNNMSLFDGNNTFGNDFQAQTHVIKSMNNSFLNKTNLNMMKNNNNNNNNEAMNNGKKQNRAKRPSTITPMEMQKISELKRRGDKADPICLDD